MCVKPILDSHAVIVYPQEWATGLKKSSILNLLETPHFKRSTEINAHMKLLLIYIHGGFFRLLRGITLYGLG
jgi:hypothetical protein